MPKADLLAHKARLERANLADLAAATAVHASALTGAGWSAHLERQRLDDAAWHALYDLAQSVGLPEAIEALFSAKTVNPSENRPALHWALRTPSLNGLDGEALSVRESLEPASIFAERLRTGAIATASGTRFENIIHIGIGGSDFGPRLLADAFHMERDRRFNLRFCANLDPIDLDLALEGCDPHKSLVIGVSKSFGTEETLYNLTRAKAWLAAALGDKAADHMALVTSRPDRAHAWLGTAKANCFDMPASVGGRFSIWSNAALACQIALGPQILQDFHAGAHEMDTHFKTAKLAENLPCRLALLDYWNASLIGYPMRVVLAYARRLRFLPTYLQQLEMESNGKSVGPQGIRLQSPTAPALWGGEGSVGQHSYHQWLHQSGQSVPTEFILAPDANSETAGRRALTAHALAQAEVLANGRSHADIQEEEPDLPEAIAAQKIHVGGRPSSFLTHSAFGPKALGALIALYEHRTYAAGVLWGVNSFDQWGVEAGKTMAGRLKAALQMGTPLEDAVTAKIANGF